MSGVLNDLKDEIAKRRVTVIVGAGVSIQATAGAECSSWRGLLEHGARRAADVDASFRVKRRKIVEEEIASGDLDNMLSAAEKIARSLGAPTGGEYRRWLRESVGALRVVSGAAIEALRELDAVIATTNYDELLARGTGRDAVTWRNGPAMSGILQGEQTGILHLHGFWKEPESVVMGIRSYEEVVRNEHAQNVLRALTFKSSLLFVGCGAGLEDPNFEQLRAWMVRVMGPVESRSYRLAVNRDVAGLERLHGREERISVLGYGEREEDLVPFLRSLVPSSRPKTRSAALVVRPLPAPPPRYGREEEVTRLVAEVLRDKPAPVAVIGPPGIGKSTIVLAALHDAKVAAKYGERRYLVRCDGVESAAALVAEVGLHLGVETAENVESAVFAALASAPVVLALDNVETPLEVQQEVLAVEGLLGRLASVPGVALIVALRGVDRPGGVKWAEPLQPPVLSPAAAREAFLAIAGGSFASDPALERLIDQLGYVPAAVTLMAYVAQGEPDLRDVSERWERERTEMLQREGGTDRSTNLEVSYESSWVSRHLSNEARRLLSVLSLLPAGVAREDVQSVAPAGCAPELSRLRKRGLVQDACDRIQLLAPLREFVVRRHPASDDDVLRAEELYAGLLKDLVPRLGTAAGRGVVKRLVGEVANIEAMLTRALSRASAYQAIDAAVAWGEFVRFTGQGTVKPLLAGEVAAVRAGDRLRYANCAQGLGDIALRRRNDGEAWRKYEEALRIYEQVDDLRGRANCTKSLGDVQREQGHQVEARRRYEDALQLYRQHEDDDQGHANCIKGLGDVALELSELEEARRHYVSALPFYEKVGDARGRANCIKSLADTELRRASIEEAEKCYEQALTLYEQVGDLLGQANCKKGLGDSARRLSKQVKAQRHYDEALLLYERAGDLRGSASVIKSLAESALDQREPLRARERYGAALRMYQRIPDLLSVGWTHFSLAELAPTSDERALHIGEAERVWRSIDRADLVDELARLSAREAPAEGQGQEAASVTPRPLLLP